MVFLKTLPSIRETTMKHLFYTTVLSAVFSAAAPLVQAQTAAAPAADPKHPVVVINTTKGSIMVRLDAEKAPKTVENFLAYVTSGFYTNTLFHRVIPGFMIQGGGVDTKSFTEKPTRSPIVNEWNNGLKHVRGSIAMARRPSSEDTATSQFFINLVNNPSLDSGHYAVFGEVILSMETVDTIAKVKTGTRGNYQDMPVENVVITSVTVNK
jgi:peptidyl-prolyl cis-trans isomerase A (cyclophilin A)